MLLLHWSPAHGQWQLPPLPFCKQRLSEMPALLPLQPLASLTSTLKLLQLLLHSQPASFLLRLSAFALLQLHLLPLPAQEQQPLLTAWLLLLSMQLSHTLLLLLTLMPLPLWLQQTQQAAWLLLLLLVQLLPPMI
jgi:hypothetical protein